MLGLHSATGLGWQATLTNLGLRRNLGLGGQEKVKKTGPSDIRLSLRAYCAHCEPRFGTTMPHACPSP